MKGYNLELLEFLAMKAGCAYLSDLPRMWYALPVILENVDSEAFSIEEWNDAVHYLTGEGRKFATQKQAIQFLRAWCSTD